MDDFPENDVLKTDDPVLSDNKRMYSNCRFRCFCYGDEVIRSWLKAKKLIDSGKDVKMFVHAPGFGIWETTPIIDYTEKMFSVEVETKRCFYYLKKREKSYRVKRALFYIEGADRTILGNNRHNLNEVMESLKEGKKVRAEVEFPHRQTHMTSPIVALWPGRRKLETENHSVYYF